MPPRPNWHLGVRFLIMQKSFFAGMGLLFSLGVRIVIERDIGWRDAFTSERCGVFRNIYLMIHIFLHHHQHTRSFR